MWHAGKPSCHGKSWNKAVSGSLFTERPWCVNPVTGGTGSVIDGDVANGDRHAGALNFETETVYQGIVATEANGVGYLTGGSGFLIVEPTNSKATRYIPLNAPTASPKTQPSWQRRNCET